ncbi:MAG TPA: hypothetical protein VGH28_14955 [Polyangiaceae bacterium]
MHRSRILALALVSLAACATSVRVAPVASAPTPRAAPVATNAAAIPAEPPGPELPRGGRALFPRYRLVGFCGTPGAPNLGELTGNIRSRAKELTKLADQYGGDREVMPVFELIAVLVMGAPGPDKTWRRRVPDSVVEDYLAAARENKAILLLNIQPGHSDFVTEVKAFERFLREPDVGVALDPEWQMWKPDQKPGSVYGQTTGEVIDEVGGYLSGLVRDNHLPEKALVFHQVNGHVLKDEQAITAHPGVAVIKSVDGLGFTRSKIETYHYLVKSMPAVVHPGFKLFFDEDVRYGGRIMAPKEVMALTPLPEYVMYE